MKAHEETWNIEACFGFVKDVAGNIVAEVSTLTTANAMVETAQFISAAPDMARALLAMGVVRGGEWHSRFCESNSELTCHDDCSTVDAALKKAGIL